MAAKHNGVPVRIVHAHSTNAGIKQSGNKKRFFLHYFHRGFIKNLATNYFACSQMAGKWMFGKQKFTLIPNGVDVDSFKYNEKKRIEIRNRFHISDKFVIGHVGRFHQVKNHSFIIDVFSEINLRNKDTILLLVGDGALRKEIEHAVEQLHLKERVIFTGARFDVADLMQAMDVFIFPSIYEGFGIALIEAQSNGLCCFVSEAIPKDAYITELMQTCVLEDGPKVWADKILHSQCSKRKYGYDRNVKDAGYDQQDSAVCLEAFYLKWINRAQC